MFFRSNTYWFDRVGFAADQNGTFIAPVDNTAVVVMLPKTSLGPGQKCFQADWAAHAFGQCLSTLPSFASLATELPPRNAVSTSLGGLKGQGDTVVAIALAGGPGSVVKDMALMAAAAPAVILSARNQQPKVLAGRDGVGQGLPKTGPAGAAVEFGCGGKQRQLAAAAQILTCALLLVEGTAEGSLSAMFAQHLKSGRAQSLFPSGFTELPLGIAAGWRCCLGIAGASP
jgi:hypothetical protein